MLERERSLCLHCKCLKEFVLEDVTDLEHIHYFCDHMKFEVRSVMAKETGVSYIPCVVKCDMHEQAKTSPKA